LNWVFLPRLCCTAPHIWCHTTRYCVARSGGEKHFCQQTASFFTRKKVQNLEKSLRTAIRAGKTIFKRNFTHNWAQWPFKHVQTRLSWEYATRMMMMRRNGDNLWGTNAVVDRDLVTDQRRGLKRNTQAKTVLRTPSLLGASLPSLLVWVCVCVRT